MFLNPQDSGEDKTNPIEVDRNIKVVRGVTTTGQISDTEFGQKEAVAFAAGREESFPSAGWREDCLRKIIKDHIKLMRHREQEE